MDLVPATGTAEPEKGEAVQCCSPSWEGDAPRTRVVAWDPGQQSGASTSASAFWSGEWSLSQDI